MRCHNEGSGYGHGNEKESGKNRLRSSRRQGGKRTFASKVRVAACSTTPKHHQLRQEGSHHAYLGGLLNTPCQFPALLSLQLVEKLQSIEFGLATYKRAAQLAQKRRCIQLNPPLLQRTTSATILQSTGRFNATQNYCSHTAVNTYRDTTTSRQQVRSLNPQQQNQTR